MKRIFALNIFRNKAKRVTQIKISLSEWCIRSTTVSAVPHFVLSDLLWSFRQLLSFYFSVEISLIRLCAFSVVFTRWKKKANKKFTWSKIRSRDLDPIWGEFIEVILKLDELKTFEQTRMLSKQTFWTKECGQKTIMRRMTVNNS